MEKYFSINEHGCSVRCKLYCDDPRGIRRATDLRTGVGTVSGSFYDDNAGKGSWKQGGLGNPDMNGGKTFIVGVRSAGPDRQWDTEDDISTWPEEVD